LDSSALPEPLIELDLSFMRDLDDYRESLPADVCCPPARTPHNKMIGIAILTHIALKGCRGELQTRFFA
jgi:hypothetical protein